MSFSFLLTFWLSYLRSSMSTILIIARVRRKTSAPFAPGTTTTASSWTFFFTSFPSTTISTSITWIVSFTPAAIFWRVWSIFSPGAWRFSWNFYFFISSRWWNLSSVFPFCMIFSAFNFSFNVFFNIFNDSVRSPFLHFCVDLILLFPNWCKGPLDWSWWSCSSTISCKMSRLTAIKTYSYAFLSFYRYLMSVSWKWIKFSTLFTKIHA
jgi:hypothetical protein